MTTEPLPLSPPHLSVIVPVFNEVDVIDRSWKRLTLLPSLLGRTVEIVLVDDGSTDGTSRLLESYAAESAPGLSVRLRVFSRNFGHSAAVLAGLEAATGGYVAILDADLQDPPELLPRMLEVLQAQDVDVVYGQRRMRQGETFFKRATAWTFYRLWNRMMGLMIPPDAGDFRVMTKAVRDAVLQCGETEPFLRGLVSWVGFRQVAFPYVRDLRVSGTTKYPVRKMLRFAALAIVGFSTRPLRLAIFIGLIGLLFSLAVGSWALWSYLVGGTVRGWTSLLAAFAFIQSFTLVLLGVQGVYIARIYDEAKSRPRFIVRKDINGRAPAS